ncbi:helix-turn-helix domain-containing protein [Rhodobium gokarnense]|uniref:Two-component system cell cycle response regulator CtrA n=1 Tax=Rhodobium gokarnense TaxID=364296 RepID=A0ABT3HH39_9HYPH|nr:helix-turn-helix domain-containing protein [Rhodobium gokarnense]MCW2309680.1 two-component system cell cycle response regulator CtrA [Rhodobium gokarnense]
MDANARLEVVENENEVLRARIAVLEDALMETKPLPIEWSLTGAEACVFGVLVNRSMATKDAILAALYRDVGKDEAEPKIVDVFICKLRKKLRLFDVEIRTVWGQGYALAEETRRTFKKGAAEQNSPENPEV